MHNGTRTSQFCVDDDAILKIYSELGWTILVVAYVVTFHPIIVGSDLLVAVILPKIAVLICFMVINSDLGVSEFYDGRSHQHCDG